MTQVLSAVTVVLLLAALGALMAVVGRQAVLSIATFSLFGLVYGGYRVSVALAERRADATDDVS